jgi:hypothetical protein
MLIIPPPGSNRRNYKNAKSAVLGGKLRFGPPPQPAPAAVQAEAAQADAAQADPAQADAQEQRAAEPPKSAAA